MKSTSLYASIHYKCVCFKRVLLYILQFQYVLFEYQLEHKFAWYDNTYMLHLYDFSIRDH